VRNQSREILIDDILEARAIAIERDGSDRRVGFLGEIAAK